MTKKGKFPLVHLPVPTPGPIVATLKITITPVPVPTVTPTIYVKVPDEGLDFWKDVIFGNFTGALLGVAASVWVASHLVRKEREARIDERRRDHGQAFLAALTQMANHVIQQDWDASHAAYIQVIAEAPPLMAGYGNQQDYFHQWIVERLRKLSTLWTDLSSDTSNSEPMRDHLNEMIALISLWLDDPEPMSRHRPPDSSTDVPSGAPDNRWWRRLARRMPVEVRLRYRGFGRGAR
ncbi:hypothetical protein [Streptosporangium sp. NPDC020145]|uniref:hypothetical protein n=1 Tax=Streptosporangium sp. NPDC020145 TaxID=3154694 RepID=UPI00341CD727